MLRFLTLCLLLSSGSLSYAATWYASATGSTTGAGTRADPWDVTLAVNETSNPGLAAGDTVLFLAGTFVCTNSYQALASSPRQHRIAFQKSGTVEAPIVYKSERLWQAKFDGEVVFPTSVSNIVFEGFTVFWSGSINRNATVDYEYPNGITQFGPDITIQHNLCMNVPASCISSWSASHGKTLAGNIVAFSGCYDFTHISGTEGPTWEGAERGSGFYLEGNDSVDINSLVSGNITFHNLTSGLLVARQMSKFIVTNNVNFASREGGGLLLENRTTPANGVVVGGNYLFGSMGSEIPAVMYGYTDAGSEYGTGYLIGNYLVGSKYAVKFQNKWAGLYVTNNTMVQLDTGNSSYRILRLEDVAPTWEHTYEFGNNAYFSPNVSTTDHFVSGTTDPGGMTWAEWQTWASDSTSTFANALPTALTSFVFRPSTNMAFVHVAVFNWPQDATTTVDMSSYFSAGQRLYIYDAQNVPTAYTNFVYDGSSPVTLQLNLTDKATMLGEFTDYAWNGFDPRFRAFVIHHEEPLASRAGSVRVNSIKGR